MENKQITYGQAVALRVKELMGQNITKNKLAESCNIPSATITELLEAKYDYPSPKTIIAICKFFNMELHTFFDSPYFYL